MRQRLGITQKEQNKIKKLEWILEFNEQTESLDGMEIENDLIEHNLLQFLHSRIIK